MRKRSQSSLWGGGCTPGAAGGATHTHTGPHSRAHEMERTVRQHSHSESTMIEPEARAFVARLSAQIHPIMTEYNLAQWQLATTGAPEQRDALERLGAAYTRLFLADPADWATIQRLHAGRATIGDPLLRREVELLYASFAGAQVPPEQIDRLSALEAGLADLYTNFRGTIDGRLVPE